MKDFAYYLFTAATVWLAFSIEPVAGVGLMAVALLERVE